MFAFTVNKMTTYYEVTSNIIENKYVQIVPEI